MAASVVVSPPQLIGSHRCRLGESLIWDAEHHRLLFCDINGQEILSVDPEGGDLKRWAFPQKVGSFGLCESGRWIVALARGVVIFDPETGESTLFADPEPEPETNRLNDGKVGPDGAFWIGSMDDRPQKEPRGALYRVSPNGSVEKKVGGLLVSNGLAWSGDGQTMFHSDSRGPWIAAHDFDPSAGLISNERRIAILSEAQGRPDGGACDQEGCYWSAGVSAQCLNRFDRNGKLLETIPMPIPACTMPCFAGDDLDTLYVTSLSDGLPPERAHPDAGALVRLRVSVPGVPVGKFRDQP
jgi:sugar lactone lactonase YvrE